MKKAKFMALALAGAITLMGAGYAAWTDKVTLSSSVSTGHLDLYYTSKTVNETFTQIPAYVTPGITFTSDAGTDITNPDYTDVATITLTNMYPGAQVTANLEVNNRSTIPVMFAAIPQIVPGNSSLTNAMDVTIASVTYTPAGQNTTPVTVTKDNLASLASVQIKEGTKITFTCQFDAKDGIAEDTTYSASVTPQFKQFNQ
ncbi:hypothetical protein HMPREF1982_02641 [Clostridiales bacterium oral taxon 876 str. F0540]|nr:hypothetical protein HMPREF1982_02641 [Clostridiales bacterium oral taxon 876 str. F0540]